MDSGKIMLVNLSKGMLGEDNSKLLGMIMTAKIQMAAMSRADIPLRERKDFYVYVDEFQNLTTDSFALMLSEARKYRVSLILAHQFIRQLTEPVRDAVLGNIGTLASFRIGAQDAPLLAQEFSPWFREEDVKRLPNHTACVKLLIEGYPSDPFIMSNVLTPKRQDSELVAKVRDRARRFVSNKGQVAADIERRILNPQAVV